MSNYAQRKAQLQAKANARYNNASGSYGSTPSLPDTARTIKIKVGLVDGTGTTGGVAKIFGAVRAAANKAANTANNTVVTLVNGDIDELYNSLISGDIMRFGKATMNVVNDAQAEEVMTIIRKKYNGQMSSAPLSPGDSRSPKDQNPNLLEIENFNITLDAYTEFEYPIDKSVGTNSVIMTFYIEEQVDNSALLRGGEMVKTNYGMTAAQKRDQLYRR